MAGLNKSDGNMDNFFAEEQDAIVAQRSYVDSARTLLADEFTRDTSRSSSSGYWVVAGASGLLAAAVLLVLLLPGALSVTLNGTGEVLEEGAFVSASGASHELAFSDGSVVGVKKDAEVRLLKLHANGAEMVLESGELEADIIHARETRWMFHAGPYKVRVVGTGFNAAWDRGDKEFNLKLREGEVVITGPMLEEGKTLVAGEEIDVSLVEKAVSIRRIGAVETISGNMEGEGPAAEEEPAVAPVVEPVTEIVIVEKEVATSVPSRRAVRSHDVDGNQGSDWQGAASAGDYARALELAEVSGFESVVATASRADLLSLADAARLGKNPRRAEQAYTAVRTRFPSTEQSQRAAFSVGRMYFTHGKYARAAQWFKLCINDNRAGTMTREAAGRLIESLDKAGNRSGAVAAARQYLSVFPTGPHARLAKKIAQEADSE